MTNQELGEFYMTLGQDPDLMAQLRDETDRASFISRLVVLAADRGYSLTTDEVAAVMSANYACWMQRWA